MSNEVKDREISFEEALEKLESSARSLKSDGIPLQEAIKQVEDGIKYYDLCLSILEDAKQKIEVYSEENK